MKLTNPEQIVCRTMVLDYFTDIQENILTDATAATHTIFDFTEHMRCANVQRMLTQVCWEIGFDRSRVSAYITGEDPLLLDNYPELAYFRDIVFMFKYMMAPRAADLPPVKQYTPSDARLHWSRSPKKHEKTYIVRGFGLPALKCVAPIADEINPHERKSSGGFMSSLLSSVSDLLWTSQTRVLPSGADPSAVVGEQINNEDDVLHIKTLPDFDGRLCQRDAELLIQYLTVPYLRIPLVIRFLSQGGRLQALGSLQVRTILDGILFEPGVWCE